MTPSSPTPPPPTSLSMPLSSPQPVPSRSDALKALIDASEKEVESRKRRRETSPLTDLEDTDEDADKGKGQEREDGDGFEGMPRRTEFEREVEKYLGGLGVTKRGKALLTRETYAEALSVHTRPGDTSVRDAGFRFWSRQRFTTVDTPQGKVLSHDNRKVVVREEMYDALVEVHQAVGYAGRDKTYTAVTAKYCYIPKEVASAFVRICPTCASRRAVTVPSRKKRTQDAATNTD
ncbi:hypothetical protein JCM11251_006608 [Rhodosporidiobolus azoricus]